MNLVNIINVELAAMVDFEFRPGRPPEQLAEQLAKADAAKSQPQDQGFPHPPQGFSDPPAMSDLSRRRYPSRLAPISHPVAGEAFILPWSRTEPIVWTSNLREAWSDRIWRLREAWPDRTQRHFRRNNALRRYERTGSSSHFEDVDDHFEDIDDPGLQLLAEDYRQSEPWLWYQSEWLGKGEAPLFQQRRRLFLHAAIDDPDTKGLQVLLLPQRGVGVATVWIAKREWLTDPWKAKHSLWGKEDYWRSLLAPTGLLDDTELSSERKYVFVAIRVDTTNLTDFCHDELAKVTSWFTGSYEHESPERQNELIGPDSNLSRRSYERLFMRSTDALALYNLDVVQTESARDRLRRGVRLHPDLDQNYRLARCRAAQLFEHCIITRRILRTDNRRISRLSTKSRLIRSAPVVSGNWRRANAVLSAFSQAELEMVTAPPVRSVEAEELVRATIERCGIPALVEDTRRGYDLLERRLQWARGQWLAFIAVCAFIANALIAIFHS